MTYLFLAITIGVSLVAFYNREVFQRLMFNAYAVKHHNEWYRFFSYGLVHADWTHLFINMFVLYSFGLAVENFYRDVFGNKAILFFVLLYIGGILFSTLYDFGKHKDEQSYNAVGASGAVSAIVFASIVFYPAGKIYLFLLPFGIPSFVFGILYLIYSAVMAKRGKDNIGHNAHFWGAIFGFVFTILLKPRLAVFFYDQVRTAFG